MRGVSTNDYSLATGPHSGPRATGGHGSPGSAPSKPAAYQPNVPRNWKPPVFNFSEV